MCLKSQHRCAFGHVSIALKCGTPRSPKGGSTWGTVFADLANLRLERLSLASGRDRPHNEGMGTPWSKRSGACRKMAGD